MTEREPRDLRRWTGDAGAITIFSCARPGRTMGRKAKIGDNVVNDWIAGLPRGGPLSIISLLGKKKESGLSEFSFYSFGSATDPASLSGRPAFHVWLQTHHPELAIELREHPTVDGDSIPLETLAAIEKDVKACIADGRIVVVMDSGGVQRVALVCRHMGFVRSVG